MQLSARYAVSAYLVMSGTALAQSADPLDVDVCIVGGGATGAYAAVRLREDFNKTVVVIEKADRLVRKPSTFMVEDQAKIEDQREAMCMPTIQADARSTTACKPTSTETQL